MRKIVILTGPIRSGKTNTVKAVSKKIQKTIDISGILTVKVFEKKSFIGYDIFEIVSGKQYPFLRSDGDENMERLGRFYIQSEAASRGNSAIETGLNSKLLIIDEIGPLELTGKGFSDSLISALERASDGVLLIVVRDTLIEEVIESFGIDSFRPTIVPPFMWKDLYDILYGRLV